MAHEGHWREKSVYGENKGPLALSKLLQSLTGVKNKTKQKVNKSWQFLFIPTNQQVPWQSREHLGPNLWCSHIETQELPGDTSCSQALNKFYKVDYCFICSKRIKTSLLFLYFPLSGLLPTCLTEPSVRGLFAERLHLVLKNCGHCFPSHRIGCSPEHLTLMNTEKALVQAGLAKDGDDTKAPILTFLLYDTGKVNPTRSKMFTSHTLYTVLKDWNIPEIQGYWNNTIIVKFLLRSPKSKTTESSSNLNATIWELF